MILIIHSPIKMKRTTKLLITEISFPVDKDQHI